MTESCDKMSSFAELLDREIPEGRNNLLESQRSLLEVALHCEENYLKADNKTEALAETKQYARQSLASVAHQINSLAMSMLQMFDLQGVQLADIESSANHLARCVNAHKEKVARREIGVLTTSKNCSRDHKITMPRDPEKPMKYKSARIDYGALDDIGHGLKIDGPARKTVTSVKQRNESVSSGDSGGQESVFFVYQPEDKAPPSSPIETDLYTSVRRNLSGPKGSPKSVKHYRFASPKITSDEPPSPPPPPPGPEGYEDLPLPPPGMPPPPPEMAPPPMTSAPMAPPPPPLPGMGTKDKTEGGTMMMMPPPPPPDMLFPPNTTESFLPPPPPMDTTPHTSMVLTDEDMPPPPEFLQTGETDPQAPAEYLEKVIAIYGYEKNYEDELTFQEDDIIYVLKKNPNGWFEGVLNGVSGLFPGNYVQTVP